MTEREVGRWVCAKCGGAIVAAGRRDKSFPASGAFTGRCPWDCGAWINRSFRHVRPGQIAAFRGDEWDQRAAQSAS